MNIVGVLPFAIYRRSAVQTDGRTLTIGAGPRLTCHYLVVLVFVHIKRLKVKESMLQGLKRKEKNRDSLIYVCLCGSQFIHDQAKLK